MRDGIEFERGAQEAHKTIYKRIEAAETTKMDDFHYHLDVFFVHWHQSDHGTFYPKYKNFVFSQYSNHNSCYWEFF